MIELIKASCIIGILIFLFSITWIIFMFISDELYKSMHRIFYKDQL